MYNYSNLLKAYAARKHGDRAPTEEKIIKLVSQVICMQSTQHQY